MASDGKLKDFGSGLTRCFWIGYLKALPFPLKKIDHSVFHILLAPQQSPGLLFQYPEMITLPAKADTAAVIVKAEHRLKKKNTSFLPQITTVRPIAPLNFHIDPRKPSSATAVHPSLPQWPYCSIRRRSFGRTGCKCGPSPSPASAAGGTRVDHGDRKASLLSVKIITGTVYEIRGTLRRTPVCFLS